MISPLRKIACVQIDIVITTLVLWPGGWTPNKSMYELFWWFWVAYTTGLHFQKAYTHWGTSCPQRVYAFWKCKPVIPLSYWFGLERTFYKPYEKTSYIPYFGVPPSFGGLATRLHQNGD